MKIVSTAAAIALAFVAGSAIAADLPSRKGPPVYAAPMFTWTGFYAGVNVGGGWTESEQVFGSDTFSPPNVPPADSIWAFASPNASGVLGGGQIGYNYQFNGFVVGVEADIQAADLTGDSHAIGTFDVTGTFFPFVTTHQTIDWFGTVRGRLGYAVLPNLLVYGTGGFAYGAGTSRFTFVSTSGAFAQGVDDGDTQTGWTAGGGVEWMFWPNVSAKVEYLFVHLENSPGFVVPEFAGGGGFNGFFASQTGVSNRFHTVKAGLNYHFNLFGAAPVVAGY